MFQCPFQIDDMSRQAAAPADDLDHLPALSGSSGSRCSGFGRLGVSKWESDNAYGGGVPNRDLAMGYVQAIGADATHNINLYWYSKFFLAFESALELTLLLDPLSLFLQLPIELYLCRHHQCLTS